MGEQRDHVVWNRQCTAVCVAMTLLLAGVIGRQRWVAAHTDAVADAVLVSWSSPAAASTVATTFNVSLTPMGGIQAGDHLIIGYSTMDEHPFVDEAYSGSLSGGEASVDVRVSTVDAATGTLYFLAEVYRDGAVVGATRWVRLDVAAFTIAMGSNAVEQALWDDAGRHTWSKYGGSGGDAAETLDATGPPPIAVTMPNGTDAATYTVRITCAGATWGECVLSGVAPEITVGRVDNAAGVDGGRHAWLPCSTGAGDAWDALLGLAGVKSFAVELVRASDGTVVASDTAEFTMSVREAEPARPSRRSALPST
ncbi:MAG TPA: hypothetical protein DGT21_11705 [Armatimonadetes bacterium]|jgi:hypothetical protein|nr:hypothetical protein [Armatimonadota bacterium]